MNNIKFLINLLTKNETQIPLLYVTFDYKKFKENGKIGSCMSNVHPVIANDENIKLKVNELIDYIRENYNMEDI